MPRRQSDLMTLCCPIGPRERIACDDMRAVLALDNDVNLVRTALHFYAEFVLGKAAVDTGLFALRTKPARRKFKRPAA